MQVVRDAEALLIPGQHLSKHGVLPLDVISLDLEVGDSSFLALPGLVGCSSITEDAFILSLFLLLGRLRSFARWEDLFDLRNRLAPCFPLLPGRLC